jgi:tRNA(Ile)-lysidine synthase
MLQNIKIHLEQNFANLKNKKLLVATSGGMDSMVMLHLLQELNYTIAIAHCNFKLRGEESDGDLDFVENYANTNGIPIFTTIFNTKQFAEDYKLSIQVAARNLRYNWFYELLETENYDYIVTAHHADDNLETFLINLIRGTGLSGLVGIPEQNNQVIRPLLPFSRLQIESYLQQKKLQWREDSSNQTTKYVRNRIRKDLIPILKEINPSIIETFNKSQNYLQQTLNLATDATILVYQQVVKQENTSLLFDLKKLLKLPNFKTYLYEWLKEYQFQDWESVYNLVNAQSGKQVLSTEYRLIKNRDFLVLEKNKQSNLNVILVDKNQKEVKFDLNIAFTVVKDCTAETKSSIFVDEDKLKFPLLIRKWEQGDYFFPSGMNGKKKLSKYFKDEKMSLIEKENTWLLCSDNSIVWVINKRADKRFEAKNTTSNILKISLFSE